MILFHRVTILLLQLLQLLLLLCKLGLSLFRLIDELEHFEWHFYHELNLKFEPLDVAHHLINLFEDLFPFCFVAAVCCYVAGLRLDGLEEVFDDRGTAHLDHVGLEVLQPVDLVDDFGNWLTVFVACLGQVEQQRHAE